MTLPRVIGGDTYAVPCHCENCGHRVTLKIAKGDRAPRKGLGRDTARICPNCGCRDLVRQAEWGK